MRDLRFARYAAGLRAVVEALWLGIYALVTVLIVNLVVPATSQGAELVESLADASNRVVAIVSLLASALYCAAACAVSAALVIRFGRVRSTGRRSVLQARRAVPFWFAGAVFASCSALVLPLGVVAFCVPVALLASILALPALGRGVEAVRSLSDLRLAVSAAILAAVGVAVGIAIVLFPVSAARALGAWPIIYVASGFWTIVGSVVFVVLPKRAGLPALMLLPLAIFAAFSWTNDNHGIRLGAPSTAAIRAGAVPAPLGTRFDAWLRAACTPSPQPCPVYLVAAQGGGARAAYWTASVLQALDARTHGRFTRHLFAISAVSGGALGAAAFVAAKADEAQDHLPNESAALRAFLGDDYLSPIVGALAFPDFVARFAPVPLPQFDRATAFELALERSWRVAFHTDRFAQDLNALYAQPGGIELPSLLLNATNVETGKRFVISNLAFDPTDRGDAYYAYDPTAAYRISAMPLSTAVHLGARFPFVSPHGVVSLADVPGAARAPWGRIVDGGYYDNSGTATLADLLDALVRHQARARSGTAGIHPQFIALVISSDVDAPAVGVDGRAFIDRPLPRMPSSHMMMVYRHGDMAVPQRSLQLAELDSPIEALLEAREAHADAEMRHLAQHVSELANSGGLQCAMAGHGFERSACVPVPVFVEYSYARALASQDFAGLMTAMSRNRADRRAISQLIKPGLGWTLSARSRHALDVLSIEAVARQSAGSVSR